MPKVENQTAFDNIDSEPKTGEVFQAGISENLADETKQKTTPEMKEFRRRQQILAGIKPLYQISNSGEFENREIAKYAKGWAERFGQREETIDEILEYFDFAEKAIVGFLPEEKTLVACALAELLAEQKAGLDAEMLQSLALKIVKDHASGTFDRVAEYSQKYPAIIIYEELFSDFENQPQDIVHILKHEISHGLRRYGEVLNDDESFAKADKLLANFDQVGKRETYRSRRAMEIFTAADKDNPAEIEQIRHWAAGEVLTEKVTAYLKSNGQYSAFLQALWEVMPLENQRRLIDDDKARGDWIVENKFFFEKIKSETADREKLKATIFAGVKELKDEIESQDLDDDFDYLPFFGQGGGLAEPAEPGQGRQTKTENGPTIWDLFSVIGDEIEEVVPLTEIRKAA